MSEPIDLDEVQRLCDAATEGPWRVWNAFDVISDDPPRVRTCAARIGPDDPNSQAGLVHRDGGDLSGRQEDLAFIAEARTLLPRLVVELLAAREVVEVARFHAEDHEGYPLPGLDDALKVYDEVTGKRP
jgi:hypothetical protein